MDWTDKAVMLSLAKLSETRLSLKLLTQHRGICRCTYTMEPGEAMLLLPGCTLDVSYSAGDFDGPGDIEINDVDGGIIAEDQNDVSLKVIIYIGEMFDLTLQPSEPVPSIYKATKALIDSLSTEDGRWPLHFVRFELYAMMTSGYPVGMMRCQPAFRHGETIYMSPRSGRIVTREEAGAFLDRMISVPGFLMGARNAKITDVRHGTDLTHLLMTRFVLPAIGVDRLPVIRRAISDAIHEVKSIPLVETSAPKQISPEERQKRLLAMRPLMVPARSVSRT